MITKDSAQFKRIMVALDLTQMDSSIINYVAELSKNIQPEKIYFIHAVKKLEFPKEIREKMQSQGRVPDERLKELMEEAVQKKFPTYKAFKPEFVVAEGKPEAEIIRWADIKMTDLLVVGRKPRQKGSGVLPNRLVRHSKASVLLVPENAKPDFKRIFVPVDFSTASQSGAVAAQNLSDRLPGSKLKLFHANSLPTTFYAESRGGLSFMDYLDEYANNNMHAFVKRCGLEACETEVDQMPQKGIAYSIVEGAKKHKAQLMVLGENKHSTAAVFIMGSVTEGVVHQVSDVPVLVVRAKELSAKDKGKLKTPQVDKISKTTKAAKTETARNPKEYLFGDTE